MPCNCPPPFMPKPEPFSPAPRPFPIPDHAAWLKAQLAKKYEKPGGGIPKTDLAEDVQTSLGLADTAVQPDAIMDGGKIKSDLLPSYVDDVVEVANYAALPATGESGKIYVTLDTNKTYRWGGTEYVEISNPDLTNYVQKKSGATTGNFAKFIAGGDIEDSGKKAGDFAAASHTHTASQVTDLGNAATKNVGTASGTVAAGDHTHSEYATKAEAEALRTAVAGKMPSTATGADIAVSGTDATKINSALAGKLDKSGGTMTGEFRVGAELDGNFQVVPETTEGDYTPPTMRFGDGAGVVGIIWRIVDGGVVMDVSDILGTTYRIALPSASGTLALLEGIAPVFSTSATYAVKALCVYEGVLYRCTTAVTTAGAWNSANWTTATVEDVLAALRDSVAALQSGKQDALAPTQLANIAAVPNKANASDLRYALVSPSVTPGTSGWTANYSEVYDEYGNLVEVNMPEWSTESTPDGDKTGWFWYDPGGIFELLSEDQSATTLSTSWEGVDPNEEYVEYNIAFALSVSPATATLADRAVNALSLSGETILALPVPQSGHSRDFYICATASADSAITVAGATLVDAQGGSVSLSAPANATTTWRLTESKEATTNPSADPVFVVTGANSGKPQEQANWNEADTTSPAYIKNKPAIPAAQVNADWEAVSGAAQIMNKPTIPSDKPTRIYNAAGTDALDDKGGLHDSAIETGGHWEVDITESGTHTLKTYTLLSYNEYQMVWTPGSAWGNIIYRKDTGAVSWSSQFSLSPTAQTGLDPLVTSQGQQLAGTYTGSNSSYSITATYVPQSSQLNTTPYSHLAVESVPTRAIAANTPYAVGDLLGDSGKAYRCTQAYTSAATPVAPSSDTTNWTEVPVLSQKANRAANPTAGHLASLTATGDLADSGKSAADFMDANAHVSKLWAAGDSGTLDAVGTLCGATTQDSSWSAPKGSTVYNFAYTGTNGTPGAPAFYYYWTVTNASRPYQVRYYPETGQMKGQGFTANGGLATPNDWGVCQDAHLDPTDVAKSGFRSVEGVYITDLTSSGNPINFSFTAKSVVESTTPYSHLALETVPTRTIAASTAYAVGDLLGDSGKAYRCVLAYTSASSSPTAPSSDTTHWTEVPVLSQKADAGDLRYAISESTPLTVTSGAAATTLADRTHNVRTVAAPGSGNTTTITATLPPIVAGKSRDMFLNLTVGSAASDAGDISLVLVEPSGATAQIEIGSVEDIGIGKNEILISENALPTTSGNTTTTHWLVTVRHEDFAS